MTDVSCKKTLDKAKARTHSEQTRDIIIQHKPNSVERVYAVLKALTSQRVFPGSGTR